MIRPVMVNIVTAEISVLIYIPSNIIVTGVEAVSDITAFDFLISHTSAIPQTEIGNHKDRLRKLNVEVHALIVKIIRIGFAHDFIEFIVRITGIFFF